MVRTQIEVEKKPAKGESCSFCSTKRGEICEVQTGRALTFRICPNCLAELNHKVKEVGV